MIRLNDFNIIFSPNYDIMTKIEVNYEIQII